MEIQIPYNPREWAKKLHNTDKRWNVVVAHRRCGKSVAAINHLIRDACKTTDDGRFAFVCPTYRQAKQIIWDYLKFYSIDIPGIKINESELRVDYPNGGRITLYGADNPDSLRGLGLWGVVFDEYSQQPSNIFTEIIRPALADHQGYAIWIGTPKGKNDFYRLYEYTKTNEKWYGELLTVDDTGIIPTEELEDAKELMTDDEFNQEWYCSFEAAIKGSYYSDQLSKARNENRITSVPYDEFAPVDTWWDLGVGDSTAIWFVQAIGMELHLIDYYEHSGEGLPHYKKILDEKEYAYGTHYAPFDIQQKEFGTGKTRIEVAKRLGIRFKVVKKLPIIDGINAVRMMFNRLWFDETKCAVGLDAIANYHKEWDDKRGEFKANPYHDWSSHCCDALRYGAITQKQKQLQNKLPEQKVDFDKHSAI